MKQQVAAVNPLPAGLVALVVMTLLSTQTSQADLVSTFGQLLDPPNQTPHAAVVRVHAKESGTLASGSGTLVHADQQYGYVLTNWHVVREAENGEVMVRFPDGYESPATVLKTDERWDLALIKIWRPNALPMPMSTTIPVVGERLTIIGYGSGKYRAANGKCQHYAAPDNHSPQEMIEVSVAARQGDSGGPIVNQHGELAAVLFGSGQGVTTGTHIGRIVRFLNSVAIGENSTSNTNVATETVVAPDKARQASFVTLQENTVTAASTKASQYYQLPPLEWSTVEDMTEIAAATRSKSVKSKTTAQSGPTEMTSAPIAFIEQTPKQPVGRVSEGDVPTARRIDADAERRAVGLTGRQYKSRTAVDVPTDPLAARYEVPAVALPSAWKSAHPSSTASRRVNSTPSGEALESRREVFGSARGNPDTSQYSTDFGPHSTGGGKIFEEDEVVEFPKFNLRRLVGIAQSILALVGLVTLLEKIRAQ